MDTGGYAPRFEVRESPSGVTGDRVRVRPSGAAGLPRLYAVVGLAAVAVAAVLLWSFSAPRGNDRPSDVAARDALFATSPAKLQATNLAEDARQLMFPALDRDRLLGARALFERVVGLDDDYYGGYAGLAQIDAMLAAQMPDGDARQVLVAAAREQAQRAAALAPTVGLAQSSMAVADYAGGDCSAALETSGLAVSLDPKDPYVLNFDAIVSLFCGAFQRALDVSEPHIGTSQISERLVFRNVAASAAFDLGNYEDSVDRYDAAIREGAPVAALTLAYMAASHVRLGNLEQAKRTRDLFDVSWPDVPLDRVLYALFVDREDAEQVLKPLETAGWNVAIDQ